MKISSLRSSATMRQKSSSKFDKIADQIIRTVTIKGQQRFIDQDIPEDNISKEESEKRLIVYGLVTALLFSLSSLICIILIFQAFEAKNQIILSNVPMIEDSNFPIPHVAFMNRKHDGSMLVFILINQSYFDYAWNFKAPDQGGGESQTYFMFEDLGNIYVAFSNGKLKMTVIQSPTKHFTIPKSGLRQEFLHGHSFRLGNFVMFYGGTNTHGEDINEYVFTHQCSSVNNQVNKVKTQIWSIKRKVWINGPYLPSEAGCVYFASGVSINRTHGILFHVFEWDMEWNRLESEERSIYQYCIDVFVFSAETFEWVVIKKCILFLGNDVFMMVKFTCSSYLNKSGEMQFVLLLQYTFNAWGTKITKIYKVEYPGFNHEFISIQYEDLKTIDWILFSLRSNIYLAHFYQDTASFYHVDMNMSLIPLQELKHPIISGFDVCNTGYEQSYYNNFGYEEALPFYP